MYLIRSRRLYYLSNIFYILLFLLIYIFFAILESNKNKVPSKHKSNVTYQVPMDIKEHGSDKIPATVTIVNDSHLISSTLDDIDKSSQRPSSDQSSRQIFFVETSNPDGGPLELSPREACSIESAALFHPNRDIYVIFTGSTTNNTNDHVNSTTKMDKVITDNYKNVYFRSIDIENFAKGSPLEDFIKARDYKNSKHYRSHLSDILRYIILWKYGGLFFDLDIVVLKNFDKLTENYVCKSSNNFIMSGTMHLSGTGIGHAVAEKCLLYLKDNFDGERWAANGPEVISAVMKEVCNTNITSEMSTRQCQGIQVFYAALFLPITDNFMYFREEATAVALRIVEYAYTAHIYNHASKNVKITRNSKCAYLELAKKFCPNVYNSFTEYF